MGEGKKFDTGKPRLSKIPLSVLDLEPANAVFERLLRASHAEALMDRTSHLRAAWRLTTDDTGTKEALYCVSEVLAYGARKYGWGNWRHLDNAVERYFDAALRHALEAGDDPESGLPHAWHVMTNILFLMHFTQQLGFVPGDEAAPYKTSSPKDGEDE